MTPRFAVTISMLFTELPFAARVDAAMDAGFEGPSSGEPGEPAPRGFEVVLMDFHGGDVAAGEPGRSAARR